MDSDVDTSVYASHLICKRYRFTDTVMYKEHSTRKLSNKRQSKQCQLVEYAAPYVYACMNKIEKLAYGMRKMITWR